MKTTFPRLAIALAALFVSPLSAAPATKTHSFVAASATADGHVRTLKNGRLSCRHATPDEARLLARRGRNVALHGISPVKALAAPASRLTITLRATAQLETYPEAKAAFLKAAEIWMARIQTPVTVIIDVDYGTTNFGEVFPEDVLGSTLSQSLGASDLYGDLALALDSHRPATPAFPATELPTDIGATQYGIGPSAVFRALGFIDAVANPAAEEASFGDPPAIGFNSAFAYDFNPDDGISVGKTDFVAVAVHEIGHVLGFSSAVGRKELDPAASLVYSVWDLYRFRPGVTAQTFSSANRILSSGGEQVYFEGSTSLALSTGRPDGTGGDEQQSSHWKANEMTGVYIGIMDPTIAPGVKEEITANDMLALETMGWTPGSGTAAAYSWILPSSARAPGAGGAFYTTSLSLGNRGSAEARYRLKFLGNNADGTNGQESSEFVLGPNQAVTYEDVLGSVFGLTQNYGAIQVLANVATLSVTGQTSTADPTRPGGTFGQSVPASGTADLITAGLIRSIVGIRQDTSFRTNLVLANAGTSPVTINGTLLSTSGAVLGTKSWTIPPLGMTQDGPIAPSMGASGTVRDAQLLLTTSTSGGTFAAYAAAIDNVTNDPRTLLPK